MLLFTVRILVHLSLTMHTPIYTLPMDTDNRMVQTWEKQEMVEGNNGRNKRDTAIFSTINIKKKYSLYFTVPSLNRDGGVCSSLVVHCIHSKVLHLPHSFVRIKVSGDGEQLEDKYYVLTSFVCVKHLSWHVEDPLQTFIV